MKASRCTGWWEQSYMGRHEMEGLTVSIEGEQISGGGYDIIGMFTLEGTISPDNDVSIIKHYFDSHRVLYKGEYDGANLLHGIWLIGFDSGPWEIRFRASKAEKQTAKLEMVKSQ
ncbi:MAG: hypothetical protein AAF927_16265 [Bacteroidota bacterium]